MGRELADLAARQHGVVSRRQLRTVGMSNAAISRAATAGHRVRPPRRDEVGTVHGIPCTSPSRTLVDLAGTVGDWTLRSCFERAAQKKYLDIPAIEASMDPGRRGNRSL